MDLCRNEVGIEDVQACGGLEQLDRRPQPPQTQGGTTRSDGRARAGELSERDDPIRFHLAPQSDRCFGQVLRSILWPDAGRGHRFDEEGVGLGVPVAGLDGDGTRLLHQPDRFAVTATVVLEVRLCAQELGPRAEIALVGRQPARLAVPALELLASHDGEQVGEVLGRDGSADRLPGTREEIVRTSQVLEFLTVVLIRPVLRDPKVRPPLSADIAGLFEERQRAL